MVLDIAVKDDVLRNNHCKGALKDLQREYAKDTKEVKALTLQEGLPLNRNYIMPSKETLILLGFSP